MFTPKKHDSKSPSKQDTCYSDRFIPLRSSLNSDLYDETILTREDTTSKDSTGGSSTYHSILQRELFGMKIEDANTVSKAGLSAPSSPNGNQISEAGTSSPAKSSNRRPLTPAKRTLEFTTRKSKETMDSPFSLSPLSLDTQKLLSSPKKPPRKISKTPMKVLEAPAIQDDFYLNLVDWSYNNVLAVGLSSCVYLWNASTSQVAKLCDLGECDSVTSVGWMTQHQQQQRSGLTATTTTGQSALTSPYLAVGTNKGVVQIWDVTSNKIIREMSGHKLRVGSISWMNSSGSGSIGGGGYNASSSSSSSSPYQLSTGGRDRTIYHRDIRDPSDYVIKLVGHKQEVCGLKWAPDCMSGQLASGGNDNKLLIWDIRSINRSSSASSILPIIRFSDHKAAVKAIAWSPHQRGLLASGGGTADRCIRFWNTISSNINNNNNNNSQLSSSSPSSLPQQSPLTAPTTTTATATTATTATTTTQSTSSIGSISVIDTGSQVCNIAWSSNVNEIVSTHGYSQNQIIIWSYPSMNQISTLTGHRMRVLYLSLSPDGQTIVTGAGDETLRFWNVFPSAKDSNGSLRKSSSILIPKYHDIR